MAHYRRIRNLREDKDLTQEQMGKILFCSQRVYSNYERGDIDIPTIILIRLADFHQVSIDYLLGRTDNPNTNIKNSECVFTPGVFNSSIFPIKDEIVKLRLF